METAREVWRDVPGYEGLYQISISTPEGKIKVLRNKKEKVLKGTYNKKNKRIYWCLTKNKKSTYHQAARWIAITYPELVQNEYFEGAQIDHIDGDVSNNHPSNLRWVTPKENTNNPITLERRKKAQEKRCFKHSEKSKQLLSISHINHPGISRSVEQLDKEENIINIFPSLNEAYRQTGVLAQNISGVCRGIKHTAGGYKWRYA